MDVTSNNGFIVLFIFVVCVPLVESRSCTYLTTSGNARTFLCSNYEYCCGNSCCRPAVITFYQLWYFWLSVIMIMLLCSGGSWWYRFKYRTSFLTPAGRGFMPASGPAFRHGRQTHGHTTIGVFYYPGSDRVYLQNTPKDPNSLYNYAVGGGGVVLPPPYSTTAMGVHHYNPLSHGSPLPPPTPMPMPLHQAPPPSYESVVSGGGGVAMMASPTSPPLNVVDGQPPLEQHQPTTVNHRSHSPRQSHQC